MIEVYRIELEFEEPVSVVGEADDSVLKVMRTNAIKWGEGSYRVEYGIPVIPASTIKGALRSFFLSLTKSMLDCDVVRYHEETSEPRHYKKKVLPHHEGFMPEKERLEKLKEYLVEHEGVEETYFLEEGSEEELIERLASLSCPICLLFGSVYLAGALRFSDVLLNGSERRVTRVTMNRALGKAAENKLFTLEVVEEAKGVGYAVLAFNPDLLELVETLGLECNGKSTIDLAKELWMEGKKILEEDGIILGHSKSTGMGRAKVRFVAL